ncbi:protein disulfide isomerase-related protein, partial [Cystoisospora suis]
MKRNSHLLSSLSSFFLSLSLLFFSSSLLFFLSFQHVEAGLYSPGGAVKVLNSQEFKDRVVNSHDLFVVEFYADWCGHCQRFAPEYEKAAKALRGLVQFVAVSDQAIMPEYNIRGFPTVKVFVGKGGKPPKMFDYNGPREAKDVVDFALTHATKLAKARLA